MNTSVISEETSRLPQIVEALLNETRRDFAKAAEFCWGITEGVPNHKLQFTATSLRSLAEGLGDDETDRQLRAWVDDYVAHEVAP